MADVPNVALMKYRFYDQLEYYRHSRPPKEIVSISDQRYQVMLKDIPKAKASLYKTEHELWLLKNFDILNVKGVDKLVYPKSKPVMFYLPDGELFDAIHAVHTEFDHIGIIRMGTVLRTRYKNINRNAIELYLKLCEQCQPKPLKYLSKGHITLIDFQKSPDGEYKFVLLYQDDLTKFIILKPLITSQPSEVAHKLLDIFTLFGTPAVLCYYNSIDNAKKILEHVRKYPKFKIAYGNYKKKKDCLYMEHFIKDINKSIKDWMRDNNTTKWTIGIAFTQLLNNKSYNCDILNSPFKKLFVNNIKLGIDIQGPHTLNTEEDLKKYLQEQNKDEIDAASTESENESLDDFEFINEIASSNSNPSSEVATDCFQQQVVPQTGISSIASAMEIDPATKSVIQTNVAQNPILQYNISLIADTNPENSSQKPIASIMEPETGSSVSREPSSVAFLNPGNIISSKSTANTIVPLGEVIPGNILSSKSTANNIVPLGEVINFYPDPLNQTSSNPTVFDDLPMPTDITSGFHSTNTLVDHNLITNDETYPASSFENCISSSELFYTSQEPFMQASSDLTPNHYKSSQPDMLTIPGIEENFGPIPTVESSVNNMIPEQESMVFSFLNQDANFEDISSIANDLVTNGIPEQEPMVFNFNGEEIIFDDISAAKSTGYNELSEQEPIIITVPELGANFENNYIPESTINNMLPETEPIVFSMPDAEANFTSEPVINSSYNNMLVEPEPFIYPLPELTTDTNNLIMTESNVFNNTLGQQKPYVITAPELEANFEGIPFTESDFSNILPERDSVIVTLPEKTANIETTSLSELTVFDNTLNLLEASIPIPEAEAFLYDTSLVQ